MSTHLMTPSVRALVLRMHDGSAVGHKAGQYVDTIVSSPRGLPFRRSYSIASAPDPSTPDQFELAVTRVRRTDIQRASYHPAGRPDRNRRPRRHIRATSRRPRSPNALRCDRHRSGTYPRNAHRGGLAESLPEARAYICGVSAMVDDVVTVLHREAALPRESLRYETYD
jgi:ferredoxin-NADP reductase